MNRHPESTRIRTLFVLEVELDALTPADAANQVAAITRKLTRFRDRDLRAVRALRIAVDEPNGEKVATAVLRYLDGADEAKRARNGSTS